MGGKVLAVCSAPTVVSSAHQSKVGNHATEHPVQANVLSHPCGSNKSDTASVFFQGEMIIYE